MIAKKDPFAGLDSDFGSAPSTHAEFANRTHAMLADASGKAAKEFVERCGSCGGTGRFHSYAGRFVGECFKCGGAGVLTFKTSPDQRANARKRSADKKAADRKAAIKAHTEWHFGLTDEQRDAIGWLITVTTCVPFWMNNEVAQSLIEQFRKSKSWSEKQLEMVVRWHQKAVERQSQKAEQKKVEMTPCAVSEKFVALFGLFANAKAAQKAKPILRAEGLRISEAKENSSNAGCLYVTDANDYWEDRTYLGKITPAGQFVRSKDCTDEQAKSVETVALDPLAAALHYGRLTGQCSCCGRELTNHKSVEDGIGPICREKWGM